MSETPTAHDAIVEMEGTRERNSNSASQHSEDDYKPQFYHRLARMMSKEKNLAIFRRFDEINMMQLMALQAEIVELQYRFETKCREDDDGALSYSKCFHDLRIAGLSRANDELKSRASAERNHVQGSGTSVHSQYSLLQDLRVRLDQYSPFPCRNLHILAKSLIYCTQQTIYCYSVSFHSRGVSSIASIY